MQKLYKIMKHLRSSKGCPWDRKQTLRSLRRCLIEEAYEAVEAINSGRKQWIEEELGDILCVVNLLCAVGEKERKFSKTAVVNSACRKMIVRHPHVFGTQKARTPADALKIFQAAKEDEKKKKGEKLEMDSGKCLPALIAAQKIQKKAAHFGYLQPGSKERFQEFDQQWKKLRSASRKKNSAGIYGELFFQLAMLAREAGIDAETALMDRTDSFRKQIQHRHARAEKTRKPRRKSPQPALR